MKTPQRTKPTSAKHTVSYQLRQLIESRGLSAYSLGQMSGVDAGVIQRFVTGKRDVMLGTVDRIAAALGLRLVEVARKGRPPARPSTTAEPAMHDDGEPPTDPTFPP